MNIGKRFESWVAKCGRENERLLLYRLNDSHSFGSNLARHKPPCDFVGIYKNIPIAIECKATKHNTFSYSKFDLEQVKALRRFKSYGGIALFAFLINKTIVILDVDDLPSKGKSVRVGTRKLVWKHYNLEGIINEWMERTLHTLKV